MKKIVGIYKITSPSGKIYIGQSIDVELRFKYYKRLACKTQTILHNSLVKHGANQHKFEIIHQCEIYELNDLERFYQDMFSSVGRSGMNCRLSSSSDKHGSISDATREKMRIAQAGKKHTEESKRKLSEKHKGKTLSKEHRENLSKSHKRRNWKPSEDHRKKLILASTGRKVSDHVKEKIRNGTMEKKCKPVLDLKTGVFYNSCKEAAEHLGYCRVSLGGWLRGKCKNKTSLIYA